MRPFFYSSLCVVQCVRRMCTKTEVSTIGREKYRRKAINLQTVVSSDLLINKKLGNNESIEDSQWGKVRKELLQKCQEMTEINVDCQVYDICNYYDRVDQGLRYFAFLERNKYPVNLGTMARYLKLVYLKSLASKTPLTKEEEKNVIKVYNRIRKEYEVLDPRSACNCIAGLSLTSKWEECFKLLETIKLAHKPTTNEMSTIIAATFRNDRADLGWKMMDEFLVNHILREFVYEEYLNYCKRNFTKDKVIKEMEKIFLMWQKNNIIPRKTTITEYEELFKSEGYDTEHTSISLKGICKHCKAPLQPTQLSKSDFKILASAILNDLIVGKDVYRNTSPQELKNYLIFLQSMKPYDIIIDGLNVAYATRSASGNFKGDINNILQVVNYFRDRNKRVLVVGRVHMKWWSSNAMKSLENIADVFYTKNISQDDPFLLHLTLSSGSDTCFLSRDYMRQHQFMIKDPTVKHLFKNWQMSHQYFIYPIPSRVRTLKIVEPMQFDPSPQKSDDGWHIPYTTSIQNVSPVSIYKEQPRDWLCIKPKKQQQL